MNRFLTRLLFVLGLCVCVASECGRVLQGRLLNEAPEETKLAQGHDVRNRFECPSPAN
jgi:hypothetical protein